MSFHVYPVQLIAADTEGGLLRWLLGLDRISPTDSSAVLEWGFALPAWAWLLIVLAVLALAGQTYRHLLGAKAGRVTLAAVRGALLLLVVILLLRPMLVLPRETVEDDHVLMLVDRSASMGVEDVQTSGGDRISRDQQLRQLLRQHEPMWQQIALDHHVHWLGFSENLQSLSGPADLPAAEGSATAIRDALQEATLQVAGKPVSAVVLFSDGRATQAMNPQTWRTLQQLGIGVWVVPLGAADPPADLAIQRVDSPERAFVNDTVPVSVTVRQSGADAGSVTGTANARVRLVDETTGQVLDEQPVGRLGEPVRLMHTPEAAGSSTWRVQLVTDQPELIENNNRQTLELELIDRPIRLLLVEGYPRWEYRYLKNLLVREESVDSSIMLISADRTFAQEGDTPLQRLPQTPEELEPYDVIVIGDVPASFFSSDQLQLLEQQVSVDAAGLMWIGGPRHTPTSYATSQIATLLPISPPSGSIPRLTPPIHLQPTKTAEALGVLRLRSFSGQIGSSADESSDWWPGDLPPLYWAQANEVLKPAAEVLAVDESSQYPLVMRMRYGAGQSLYVATDEIWRWRYGHGELYPQQFWMQLVRLLARGRLQAAGEEDSRAQLVVSHRRASTEETLVLELTIRDQALLEATGGLSTVDVEVGAAPSATDGRLNDSSTGTDQVITLSRTDRAGRYVGRWTPQRAGSQVLRVASAPLADLNLTQQVVVEAADSEMHYPAADHAFLEELGKRSGGTVLDPNDLQALSRIPDRDRKTAADIREPLTHSPLVFALLIVLLTGEWIGRRLLGLA